jgi:hypothetical protein
MQILKVLDQLALAIDECPPAKLQGRYGNKAYKDWFGRLVEVRRPFPYSTKFNVSLSHRNHLS